MACMEANVCSRLQACANARSDGMLLCVYQRSTSVGEYEAHMLAEKPLNYSLMIKCKCYTATAAQRLLHKIKACKIHNKQHMPCIVSNAPTWPYATNADCQAEEAFCRPNCYFEGPVLSLSTIIWHLLLISCRFGIMAVVICTADGSVQASIPNASLHCAVCLTSLYKMVSTLTHCLMMFCRTSWIPAKLCDLLRSMHA